MPRWLMKYGIEAHLGLNAKLPELVFNHPKGTYIVHLQNADVRPGIALPLLHAYVIYEADDIDTAADVGARHLSDVLDTLVFCTGSRFRTHARLALFDWTPGIEERHGRIYSGHPDPNIPQLVLDDSLIPALEVCLLGEASEPLRRALRWFSNGVVASHQDEQFQMFWFAVETIAQTVPLEKVSDRCARCREPLFCRKCDDTSTHRPYPKQKIEALFKRHLANDADALFDAVSDMRNALSHGEKISEVEQKYGKTLAQLVDILGRVAWVALFDATRQAADAEHDSREIRPIQPTTFLHYRVEPVAHVSFPNPQGREPTFSDLPDLKMELEVTRTDGAM